MLWRRMTSSSRAAARRRGKLPPTHYQGYTLASPDDKDGKIQLDRVEASSIASAPSFFEKYVAARRPCVIAGLPSLPSGETLLHELRQHAASASASPNTTTTTVAVERRDSVADKFGQGRRVEMTLQEFLDNRLETQLYYLSTQEAPTEDPSRQQTTNRRLHHHHPFLVHPAITCENAPTCCPICRS